MGKPKDTYSEILRTVAVLHSERCVVELRALGTRKGTRSGYFDDMALLASEAVNLGDARGVYLTLNPCNTHRRRIRAVWSQIGERE